MSDIIIEFLGNSFGPILISIALIFSFSQFHTSSLLLSSAEEVCYDGIVLHEATKEQAYKDYITAVEIQSEIASYPAYKVTINEHTTFKSYQFFNDGSILIVSGNRNVGLLDENTTNLVYSMNEMGLESISGKYSQETIYNSSGTLTEVIYTSLYETE